MSVLDAADRKWRPEKGRFRGEKGRFVSLKDEQAISGVSAWLSEIDKAYNGEGMSKYDDRCQIIRKRYRYEGSAFIRTRKYQLLWSNIETMKSAVYSQAPKGIVSRRYRDADPVGRVASEVLERAINFSFDASNFDGVFKQVRDDFLLYARGCARIYYEPEYETEDDLNEDIEGAEDTQSNDGGRSGLPDAPDAGRESQISERSEEGEEPGAPDGGQQLAFENVRIRFVQRSDFRHQPARTWEEVQWVAFRAFLTRAEVTKRFGKKIGDAIGLDSDPVEIDDNERPASNPGSREGAKATVWEIWDKAKNRVLWIAKNWPDVLEEGSPYLDLDGFYPCPRPAYGTLTPDSLVPVPDYIFYQDQCEEIDQLTARIGALSDALKLVGFYNGGPQGEGSPEMEKAFSAGFENKMIEVKSWDSFRQGGSNGGPPVIFLPIDQVIKILEGCVKLRQQLVEDVYQIVGIPDIMRGATDPQETEGAQQLKSQHAGNRIRDRQQEIARFCRDVGRLAGQVIASYFSPATIQKMTNITLPTREQVMMAQMQAQRQAMMQAQLAAMQGAQNGQAGPPRINGQMGESGGIGPPQLQGPPPGMGSPNGNAPIGGNFPAPIYGQSLSGQPPASMAGADQSPSQPTQEDVFGLLKDSLTRRFKIDIENDSTIQGDESQERQDRSQFIEAMTKFMEAWGPMVMQKPELGGLAGQLLLFGVRAFRVGRELEETIEETTAKLQAGPSGGAPKDAAAQAKVQAEQIKLQGTQAKVHGEIGKAQMDAQTGQQMAAAKLQQVMVEAEAKIKELQMKMAEAEQGHRHSIGEAQMAHGAAVDKMALQHQAAQQQSAANAQKQQAAQMPKWPVDPGKTQGF